LMYSILTAMIMQMSIIKLDMQKQPFAFDLEGCQIKMQLNVDEQLVPKRFNWAKHAL
jgi:hypothetical protein